MLYHQIHRLVVILLLAGLPLLAQAQQVAASPTPLDAMLGRLKWVFAKWFFLAIVGAALYVAADRWWKKRLR